MMQINKKALLKLIMSTPQKKQTYKKTAAKLNCKLMVLEKKQKKISLAQQMAAVRAAKHSNTCPGQSSLKGKYKFTWFILVNIFILRGNKAKKARQITRCSCSGWCEHTNWCANFCKCKCPNRCWVKSNNLFNGYTRWTAQVLSCFFKNSQKTALTKNKIGIV